MRICLVYDCVFPHTVGGAERWYRSLAKRLVADGHDVTYLTLRQWDPGEMAGLPGVDVRTVGPRLALYTESGRRRILPPLVFGMGVLLFLLRHGRRFDAVHTASFPYFSLLAAAAVRPMAGYRLVVDWHEVWSRAYWHQYLGRLPGLIGWLVQAICIRLSQQAFCFSSLHAARLKLHGLRGDVIVLSGEFEGPFDPRPAKPQEQLVVFAGRHIREKRVVSVVDAVAAARSGMPQLRAAILGDGPEREAVVRRVSELGLTEVIDVPGLVATEVVEDTLARGMCMLLPSSREGYGLIVVEASAHGTPSIVVSAPDNAAVELVDDGENGFIAASAEPETLAAAIERVADGGAALRESTVQWFSRNARRLSLDGSLNVVMAAYTDELSARS